MMDEQILSQIVSDYPDALTDRKKLNSLLMDYMPQEKLVRNTLLMAFDEGIVEELVSRHQADDFAIRRYIRTLTDDYGVSGSVAEQAVRLWIQVLATGKNPRPAPKSKKTDNKKASNKKDKKADRTDNKEIDHIMDAADQGDADAQYKLGLMYANGRGVEQSYESAAEWYLRAANQGNASAQCNLGKLYYTGRGVEQDYVLALNWITEAAEQGNAKAQCDLGILYVEGHCGGQNYREAAAWFRRSAAQGYGNAQEMLERLLDRVLYETLREYYGPDADFRKGQKEAIKRVLRGKRALVIQCTGWGKSLVYFMATKILRRQGQGITLIISPLLVLMKNQIESAQKLGLSVQTVNSDNHGDWDKVYKALDEDKIDALIISPERLANDDFIKRLSENRIALLVVDEAHCISDWGHDFRPDYQRIEDLLSSLPSNPPVLATTATANNRVIQDIREQLGGDLEVHRGSLMRESLSIQVIGPATKAVRLAWLAENVPKMPGSGIIYCLTRKNCDIVQQWLLSQGINAGIFYSNSSNKDLNEKKFMNNELKVLVATTAFGMGYDKPDIGFVIHFQKPGNLIAYYQQIGRAGRGLKNAYAILMYGADDDDTNKYFIRTAFPTEEMMTDIMQAMQDHPEGLTKEEIPEYAGNMDMEQITQCLKYLDVHKAIYLDDGRYYRTTRPWAPDMKKSREITAKREHELEQMNRFTRLPQTTCYMQVVAEALDDDKAYRCGKCAHCHGDPFPANVSSRGNITNAAEFLARKQKYTNNNGNTRG